VLTDQSFFFTLLLQVRLLAIRLKPCSIYVPPVTIPWRHERSKGIYSLFAMEQCVHFSCTVGVKLGHMYTRRKKLHLPAAESARRESLRLFMCRFVDWSCFSSLNKRCILNPSQRVGVCWVGTPGARAVPARSVVLHAWLRCGAAGAGAHCICHSAWPAMLCSGWLRSEWLVPCHPFCGLVRRTSICLCAAKHVHLTSLCTHKSILAHPAPAGRQAGGVVVDWWVRNWDENPSSPSPVAPIACRVQHRATCGVQHRTTCAPARAAAAASPKIARAAAEAGRMRERANRIASRHVSHFPPRLVRISDRSLPVAARSRKQPVSSSSSSSR
jgi:hypothetical protein